VNYKQIFSVHKFNKAAFLKATVQQTELDIIGTSLLLSADFFIIYQQFWPTRFVQGNIGETIGNKLHKFAAAPYLDYVNY